MAKIVFIEGVSGVGKSTMVRMLADNLRKKGHSVRAWVEFDHTNPIDFYCTAYVPLDIFQTLCERYPAQADLLRKNAIVTRNAVLLRYCYGDDPVYPEPLQSTLRKREFCYHPTHLISREQYTAAYREVWEQFRASLDTAVDYCLFDGSLLHHPINDMMRNYGVTPEEAASHVAVLLSALRDLDWQVFYLQSEDIAAQLTRAHRDRGQEPPDKEAVAFWTGRQERDLYALENVVCRYRVYHVSGNRWDAARENILSLL